MTLDILLPFYGRFDHFRRAVESVLEQDDGDWRLTIVDDRYPDAAPGAWAAALTDSRVRYLLNDENLGVAGNFARCVALAEYDHAVIFGCDDVMKPDYVAEVHRLIAAEPRAAVVLPGVEVIDSRGVVYAPLVDRVKAAYRRSQLRGSDRLGGEPLAAGLLAANWTYFPALVWRTEQLKRHGFSLEWEVVPDLGLLLDIAADGGVLVTSEVIAFQYRRHSESVSSWRAVDGSRFREESEFFADAAIRFAEMGWQRAARAARLHSSSRLNALSLVPSALRARSAAGARRLLAHALLPGGGLGRRG